MTIRKRTVLTPEQTEKIAEEAAKKALENLFLLLDIDLTDVDEIRALRKDFSWSRDAREGSEKAKKWVIGTIFTAVTGVFALLGWQVWDIFMTGLHSSWR